MASPFQPEQPHDPSRRTTGKASIYLTGIISGLAVIMLIALALPRMFEDESVNWLVTLGAGVLAAVLVIAYGFSKAGRSNPVPPDTPR